MRAFEMRSVRQLLMASVAVLLLATGTAHATERYSVRCANQLFTVYGHHGYTFFRGEPETNEGKTVSERLFRWRDDGALLFRGRKCEYVRDLLK
jgi:hypothetical protein